MNSKIDPKNLPQHIAIIMDGNRRWAAARNLKPSDGHEAGAQNLENIVNHCRDLGIKHLTVYAYLQKIGANAQLKRLKVFLIYY